jgi:hypothetical protein
VSERGVLDALRAGRTVVFDPSGRPHGPAELARLLPAGGGKAPLPSLTLGGALAWLGLLLLVAARRD